MLSFDVMNSLPSLSGLRISDDLKTDDIGVRSGKGVAKPVSRPTHTRHQPRRGGDGGSAHQQSSSPHHKDGEFSDAEIREGQQWQAQVPPYQGPGGGGEPDLREGTIVQPTSPFVARQRWGVNPADDGDSAKEAWGLYVRNEEVETVLEKARDAQNAYMTFMKSEEDLVSLRNAVLTNGQDMPIFPQQMDAEYRAQYWTRVVKYTNKARSLAMENFPGDKTLAPIHFPEWLKRMMVDIGIWNAHVTQLAENGSLETAFAIYAIEYKSKLFTINVTRAIFDRVYEFIDGQAGPTNEALRHVVLDTRKFYNAHTEQRMTERDRLKTIGYLLQCLAQGFQRNRIDISDVLSDSSHTGASSASSSHNPIVLN